MDIEHGDAGTAPADRRRRLHEWIDSAPASDARAALQEARVIERAFLEEIAERIENPVNSHLLRVPHESYAEKLALMRWVNAELRALNLAVACPKSGRPAVLVGDEGHEGANGRFKIRVVREDGRRAVTSSSVHLSALRFMPRAPSLDEQHLLSRTR